MEIAKLEAIITGDVKPLVAALDQGETALKEFAQAGNAPIEKLNNTISDTAITALESAHSLNDLRNVLKLLKSEQTGIAAGTVQWEQYQIAIKGVTDGITKLEAQLPVLASETKAVGAASGGMVKGFSNAFSSLKQIAYILPGIGIAGIFNLAFEAIQKSGRRAKYFQ